MTMYNLLLLYPVLAVDETSLKNVIPIERFLTSSKYWELLQCFVASYSI